MKISSPEQKHNFIVRSQRDYEIKTMKSIVIMRRQGMQPGEIAEAVGVSIDEVQEIQSQNVDEKIEYLYRQGEKPLEIAEALGTSKEETQAVCRKVNRKMTKEKAQNRPQASASRNSYTVADLFSDEPDDFMHDFTTEIMNEIDFTAERERNSLRGVVSQYHETQKEIAREYAGLFPVWQIAEYFNLPVMSVRRLEHEKQMYYRGK